MSKKKSEALGMPFGTASARLQKDIMFMLIKECGKDHCFRCGDTIESKDDLSIEHKESWNQSDDPVKAYFDLENIAFSHRYCNYSHGSVDRGKRIPNITGYRGVYYKPTYPKPYFAQVYVNRVARYVGYFNTAEEAAKAYDEKAIEWLGDRAVTNKKLGKLT